MQSINRRNVIGGMLAVGLAGPGKSQTLKFPPAALGKAVDTAAKASIKHRAAPGVAIAVMRHGRLVLSRGYGVANLETGTLVRADSVFRIGSLTKQFAAAAAYRLVEQGRLRLDALVSSIIPAFSRIAVIRVEELIHHTAGLHEDEAEATSPDPATTNGLRQITLANAVAAQIKPFDFEPGMAWHYSNSNYIVLGAIIEAITRQPLGQAISDLVLHHPGLVPLAVDDSGAVIPGRVSGYSLPAPDQAYINAPYLEIIDAGAAGAMRGTAPALCAWHDRLLSGQVIGKQALTQMLAPGKLRDGRLSSAHRHAPEDANYGDIEYGGGLLLSPVGTSPRTISHNGFINGFAAVLETDLDRRISFAVLCNADVGPSLPFRAVRKAVRAWSATLA